MPSSVKHFLRDRPEQLEIKSALYKAINGFKYYNILVALSEVIAEIIKENKEQ